MPIAPTLAATSPAAGLSPPPPVPSPASPLRSRAVPRGGTGARPSSPKELHSETSLAAAAAGEGRGGGGPSAYGAGGIAAAEHRWRSGTAPLIFCERDPGRRPRSAAAAAFSRAWRLPWTSCACSGAAAVGPRLPPRPIIGAAVGRPEVRGEAARCSCSALLLPAGRRARVVLRCRASSSAGGGRPADGGVGACCSAQ